MSSVDPPQFSPSLGSVDLHLLGEGRHERPWTMLGANVRRMPDENGSVIEGTSFAVWAPSARSVSVVGDFCDWDGGRLPLRSLGDSGIWERFVPGVAPGALYKYEVREVDGRLRLRADPFAREGEPSPHTASRVSVSQHAWRDDEWMAARRGRDMTREPVSIYELHVGSWARVVEEGDRPLTYRELAAPLIAHVSRLGFTHVELMPVTGHPFEASWGYQVSGYYQPAARWGTPDDFRCFVDELHRAGIGVILDWVPAHFVKDDFALWRFDGTALYEHADPQRGEHPDWGTAIFNLSRHEVRQFLIGSAMFWMEEMHVDGLRVDAVASMLYLDYSRRDGEWQPNEHGGRENLEAIAFLRELNEHVARRFPGVMSIAEESTAWPGVTRPISEGGLGFTFKWNLGWMHDSLRYFAVDPLFRPHHHRDLTFSMLYENSERFLNPLSHDEVVHGKRSLLGRMWGDEWQQFANLRCLLAYQWTRPGKKLLFMGTELAPWQEWSHDRSLPWHLADDPPRAGLARLIEALGKLYRSRRALWASDPDAGGFSWICADDSDHCVLAHERWAGWEHVVVVMNLTPIPWSSWRVGVPRKGRYRVILDSDAAEFGGSAFQVPELMPTESVTWHGRDQSIVLDLPPLALLVLELEPTP